MKRLMISLLLTSLLPVLLRAAEPNSTDTKLRFQHKTSTPDWRVESGERSDSERRYFTNPGPIHPTHVAELILNEEYTHNDLAAAVLCHIRNNRFYKNMSKAQRAFLDTELAIWVEDENPCKPNYFSTWLYAVSEADAKLMVRAYLDDLNTMNRKNAERRKEFLADHEAKLAQAQGKLPKKEAELKACQEQYEPIKKARHEFESDTAACQSAVETIAQMDTMLDSLEIELAGIRQKIETIEEYRQPDPSRDHLRSRLDEMYMEFMIELTGLEARRNKTATIRASEQRFLRLLSERDELKRTVGELRKDIKGHQREVDSYTRQLAKPYPREQGPKVFQDTVLLYRVHNPNAPAYGMQEYHMYGPARKPAEQ